MPCGEPGSWAVPVPVTIGGTPSPCHNWRHHWVPVVGSGDGAAMPYGETELGGPNPGRHWRRRWTPAERQLEAPMGAGGKATAGTVEPTRNEGGGNLCDRGALWWARGMGPYAETTQRPRAGRPQSRSQLEAPIGADAQGGNAKSPRCDRDSLLLTGRWRHHGVCAGLMRCVCALHALAQCRCAIRLVGEGLAGGGGTYRPRRLLPHGQGHGLGGPMDGLRC